MYCSKCDTFCMCNCENEQENYNSICYCDNCQENVEHKYENLGSGTIMIYKTNAVSTYKFYNNTKNEHIKETSDSSKIILEFYNKFNNFVDFLPEFITQLTFGNSKLYNFVYFCIKRYKTPVIEI